MAKANQVTDNVLNDQLLNENTTNENNLAPDTQLPEDALLSAITTDENAMHGGSYIFDPATGKRTKQ